MPVRVEIGPKDIEKQQVVLVSRLDRKKSFVPWGELAEELKRLLREDPGATCTAKAKAFRDESTRDGGTFAELKEAMAGEPRLHPLRLVRRAPTARPRSRPTRRPPSA